MRSICLRKPSSPTPLAPSPCGSSCHCSAGRRNILDSQTAESHTSKNQALRIRFAAAGFNLVLHLCEHQVDRTSDTGWEGPGSSYIGNCGVWLLRPCKLSAFTITTRCIRFLRSRNLLRPRPLESKEPKCLLNSCLSKPLTALLMSLPSILLAVPAGANRGSRQFCSAMNQRGERLLEAN